MNILFITQSEVNPLAGGVQRVTHTLANELELKGCDVFFISVIHTAVNSYSDKRQFSLPDSKQLQSKRNIEYFQQFISEKNIDFIINQIGIFPEINKFLRKVDRRQARLISVHHNCVACLNARYREIILGNHKDSKVWKKLDHEILWRILRKMNRIKYGNFFKRTIRRSDRLVLLSPKFITELRTFGVTRHINKVSAIGNPLSFAPLEGTPQKEKRIVFIGRLRLTQKRVDKLMLIWKSLHNEFRDWEFDIIGDGEERKWMESFVDANNLDRIHFHGTVDPRPYLERAKFLTSTSDFEGYHLVLVEAQAYGVIPIAYHCFSAITDLVEDGRTGHIVFDFSTEAYIHKMRAVLLDASSEHFDSMSAAMRQAALRSSASAVAEEWMKLFKEIDAAK